MAQLKQKWQYEVVDGKHVINSEMVVHRFSVNYDMSDDFAFTDAPSIIYDWQQTTAGQWVMEHAIGEPRIERMTDYMTYTYKCVILARLTEQDQTFFNLKFK